MWRRRSIDVGAKAPYVPHMRKLRRLIPGLVTVSLLFNALLLFSVTLDLAWARTRAAGGQFEEFPIVLRIFYLIMGIVMILLLRFYLRREGRQISQRESKQARWISIIFFVSTAMQLISRSADERWNAIPAVIIAYGFLRLSRRR